MCKLTMKFYHALFLLDVLFNVVGVFPYFHYTCCEFESQSGRGLQHYVIKFVSDLREFGGFLRVIRFPSEIKLTATI
jgi:hypothetical protein